MLDFGTAEKGSDLWLFWQVTDFGSDWGRLVALLTPNFDGRVWYEKDPANRTITIYGSSTSLGTSEVSYRLTAPRFDHEQWLNTISTDSAGFILDEK